MEIFTVQQGLLLLVVYTIFVTGLNAIFSKGYTKSKEAFLVGNRKIGTVEGSFSIAATWIWAPALFLGAQKAYEQGIVGVFWFIVPNVACLILFAYFADKMRKKLPDGFTLSGFMRERFSKRVQNLYIFQLIGLSVCSFAVQLLAGGSIISVLTGLDFYFVTIILAMVALGYSLASGLKGSVFTDYLQMAVILGVGFILIPWVIVEAGGFQTIKQGLGGISGNHTNLFDVHGIEVFLSFGLASTIGLMSGPFGDQSFWQRTFSMKEGTVKRTFVYGAFIFAIVPILMSLLGFVIAGNGIVVNNTQLVNLQAILTYLPQWTVIPFAFMILCGLSSTLDSCLASVASIAGHDIFERTKYDDTIKNGIFMSRIGMMLLAIVAVLIANIPNMQILYLFLFYATLRSTTLLPTIISLLSDRASESGVFYGIIASFLIGLPIFAYGNFQNVTVWIVVGSLASVLLSGIVTFAFSERSETIGAKGKIKRRSI